MAKKVPSLLKRGASLSKTSRGEMKRVGALLERGATLLKTPCGKMKRGATLLKTPRGEMKRGAAFLESGAAPTKSGEALLETSRGEMKSDGAVLGKTDAFKRMAQAFFWEAALFGLENPGKTRRPDSTRLQAGCDFIFQLAQERLFQEAGFQFSRLYGSEEELVSAV